MRSGKKRGRAKFLGLRFHAFKLERALHTAPAAGRTLIVGSKLFSEREDRRLRYPQALGVDMQAGDGVDHVLDLEEPLPEDIGQFMHVECMSVLEHSRRPWKMAANIERLLQPGGTLLVTVPFVWRVHGYPSDYWRFTKDGVRALFTRINWTAMAYANESLRHNDYVKPLNKAGGGHPYLARTEVFAFGRKA